MKVRMGSSKVWGDAEMPPHPGLSTHEIRTIIEYMLSAADERISALPLEGRYTPSLPADDPGRGHVVIRAAYTDNPVGALPSQTTVAAKVLRSPALTPAAADDLHNVTFGGRGSGDGAETRNVAVTAMHDAHLGFRALDLTGVSAVLVNTNTGGEMRAAGGVIEVRAGGPTGALLGQATVAVAPPRGRGAGPAGAGGAAGAARGGGGGGRGGPPPGTTIALAPTAGLRDLYFVFRNPQALPGQPLMTVNGISVVVN
jgi:cytochrome c